MERCHGRTKSGARCKRTVPEGSRYCASHADQAPQSGPAAAPREQPPSDPVDTLILLAAAGVVLCVALTLRRALWFV